MPILAFSNPQSEVDRINELFSDASMAAHRREVDDFHVKDEAGDWGPAADPGSGPDEIATYHMQGKRITHIIIKDCRTGKVRKPYENCKQPEPVEEKPEQLTMF